MGRRLASQRELFRQRREMHGRVGHHSVSVGSRPNGIGRSSGVHDMASR